MKTFSKAKLLVVIASILMMSVIAIMVGCNSQPTTMHDTTHTRTDYKGEIKHSALGSIGASNQKWIVEVSEEEHSDFYLVLSEMLDLCSTGKIVDDNRLLTLLKEKYGEIIIMDNPEDEEPPSTKATSTTIIICCHCWDGGSCNCTGPCKKTTIIEEVKEKDHNTSNKD